MAHFLSDVTHQRLDQRDGDGDTTFSSGVMATHEFECQARCVEVIESGAGGHREMNNIEIWTGNIDGSIVVRRGLDGEPTFEIDAKKNVFVYSLLSHNGMVWAGMSDGYIAIYDATTKEKRYEVKGHIGAINTMIYSADSIFTAGNDWQICRWDPTEIVRFQHGQFSGHQNSVQCLAGDNNVLYSGGDDNCIRAWDLETSLEKDSPWPIVAHDNSVRALALHEVYLFSSSTDGTIKVWNTQTAQLVRQIDERDAAVNTLMLDRASLRLWSGATDGTISLWDATNLHLSGQINVHHNTHVALIKEVARVNAVKSWTVGNDGKVRVWYYDTDPETSDFTALADMEASFQQEVEAHRSKIIENYRQLENAKLKLQELEELDRRKKVLIGEVFGRQKKLELKMIAQSNALHWSHKQQRIKNRQLIAEMLEKVNLGVHIKARWELLGKFATRRKASRKAAAKVKVLQQIHNDDLKRLYMGNIVENSHRHYSQQHNDTLASAMATMLGGISLGSFFSTWRRCVQRRKLLRKREEVATAIVNKIDTNLASVYWQRLEDFARKERALIAKRDTVIMMCLGSDNLLRLYYMRKLRAYVRARRSQRQALAKCMQMAWACDENKMRDAYFRWSNFALLRRNREAHERLGMQRELITSMEQKLNESQGFSEEELEKELRKRQVELANILAGNNELDLQIKEQEHKNRLLQREFLKDVTLDNEKPPLQVLNQAMHFLKSRGLNVHHDLEMIQQAREKAKSTSPEAVYEEGVTTVRKACAAAIKPQKLIEKGSYDWFVGDLFKKLTKRHVEKATVGICQMVTAYDMLNVGQLNAWLSKDGDKNDPWAPKHKHNNEVLHNFGCFLEVAVRQYRIRRNEDPITGLPVESSPKAKSKSPRRGRSKSRSASPAGAKKEKKAGSKSPSKKRAGSAPAGKKAGSKSQSRASSAKPKKATKSRAKSADGAPAKKKKVVKKEKAVAPKAAKGKKTGVPKKKVAKKPAGKLAPPSAPETRESSPEVLPPNTEAQPQEQTPQQRENTATPPRDEPPQQEVAAESPAQDEPAQEQPTEETAEPAAADEPAAASEEPAVAEEEPAQEAPAEEPAAEEEAAPAEDEAAPAEEEATKEEAAPAEAPEAAEEEPAKE